MIVNVPAVPMLLLLPLLVHCQILRTCQGTVAAGNHKPGCLSSKMLQMVDAAADTICVAIVQFMYKTANT